MALALQLWLVADAQTASGQYARQENVVMTSATIRVPARSCPRDEESHSACHASASARPSALAGCVCDGTSVSTRYSARLHVCMVCDPASYNVYHSIG